MIVNDDQVFSDSLVCMYLESLSRMRLYHSTERPLRRNSSALQYDYISDCHISSRVPPFVEFVYVREVFIFTTLPEVAHQALTEVPRRFEDPGEP
jgi:hypothetical protein